MPDASLTTHAPASRWFIAAWAATLIAALVATWPLWTPFRETPRVAPFAGGAGNVDLVLFVVTVVGAAIAVLRPTSTRLAIAIATVASALLMVTDQMRWQPWAWHALLAGTILATADGPVGRRLLRSIAIAVYGFSAIAKLDAEFAATLGPQMLGVLLRPLGADVSSFGDAFRTTVTLSLPLGELALAGLLAASLRWRRLATPACVVAVVMHATTIVVLGPWGLGHSLGVLVWNAGFAWQTVELFRTRSPNEPKVTPASRRSRPLALAACGLGGLLPVATQLGLADQWPGWALYAPRGERATLFVRRGAVEHLPLSLAPFVDEPRDDSVPWLRVRLDDWFLAENLAPIYPQNRMVAAIALGLRERNPLVGDTQVVAESAADHSSRERSQRTLSTRSELQREAQLFGREPTVVWTR